MNNPSIFRTIGSKERLVDRVAEEVYKLILNQKLQPGMKLPPERELAEQIGVSRTVIRETIQVLIAKGLVETRHGVGTIVRQLNGDQLSEHLNLLLHTRGLTLDHLHQVRSILEVEIAGLAARQCMEQEVEELSEIVDRMEAAMSEPLEYAKEDARFHRRLAQMAHNPLLVLLLDSISDLLREIRLTVSKYPQISTRGMPDHRKIMEQVRAHQVEEARLAMQQHLAHARQIQDEVIKAGEKN